MPRTKLDKIFDNKFNESRFESNSVNLAFKIDPVYEESEEHEDQFDIDMLFNEIHDLIDSSKYKSYNELDTDNKFIKLNKIQINEIYKYVLDNITIHLDKIQIWTILSEYFDIYPNKFYNSLSNIYKNDIINELDKKNKIFESLQI